MTALSLDILSNLAPDQASLNAASKLRSAAKWPVLQKQEDGPFIWGECKGSGSTPYRTVFDLSNQGYKCSCPSRKFPCKHALAVAWIYVERPNDFSNDKLPPWIEEWNGRRRGTSAIEQNNKANVSVAKVGAEPAKPAKTEEQKAAAQKRAQATAEKRKQQTEADVAAGVGEFEAWVEDQVRTGFQGLLDNLNERCRAMSARLVDAKASGLASRLDELPAKVLACESGERLDCLIRELSALLLLGATWGSDPENADSRRDLIRAETREQLENDPKRIEVTSQWQILAETTVRRRDNLIAQTTWVLNIDPQSKPRFAMLQDFYPASQGHGNRAQQSGLIFKGKLIFYPSKQPLRAIVSERNFTSDQCTWPQPSSKPFEPWLACLSEIPWIESAPLQFGAGRLMSNDGDWFWRGDDGITLPLASDYKPLVSGFDVSSICALFDGQQLTPLRLETHLGNIEMTRFEK